MANLSPHRPGPRTVLAKTCLKCGLLVGGEGYPRSGKGGVGPYCRECVSVRNRATRHLYAESHRRAATRRRGRRQAETLQAATRSGQPWTGPELEDLSTFEGTVTEFARRWGRTYAAVSLARSRLDREPKSRILAGLESPDR